MISESSKNTCLGELLHENSFIIYKKLEEIAKNELIKFYEEKEKIKLPIDIRKVIIKNKIDIAEMDLNLDMGFRMDKVNGYLRCLENSSSTDDSLKWRIYIDYSDSEFVKRYVLAHEFSHYLLKKYSGEMSRLAEDSCIDPMFPKKKKELVAETLSAYFLLPPDALLNAMIDYRNEMKKSNQYPVDSVLFLQKIGNRAQISIPYYYMLSVRQILFL